MIAFRRWLFDRLTKSGGLARCLQSLLQMPNDRLYGGLRCRHVALEDHRFLLHPAQAIRPIGQFDVERFADLLGFDPVPRAPLRMAEMQNAQVLEQGLRSNNSTTGRGNPDHSSASLGQLINRPIAGEFLVAAQKSVLDQFTEALVRAGSFREKRANSRPSNDAIQPDHPQDGLVCFVHFHHSS
jgi:hypothetical protein